MLKWPVPVITSWNFAEIRQFSWGDSKNWTVSIITTWNFCKNILDLIQPLENLNCRYYEEVKFSQKVKEGSFVDVIWKSGLLPKPFPKRRQFCWCDLKIWPAPKTFPKKKAVLMMWFETLACSQNLSQKGGSFVDVIWSFELRLSSRVKTLSKIKQFSWYHLKFELPSSNLEVSQI